MWAWQRKGWIRRERYKMEDFINLVAEMRRAQRAYFRNRTYENLEMAKGLEKYVDAWIKRHREERKENGCQGRLL